MEQELSNSGIRNFKELHKQVEQKKQLLQQPQQSLKTQLKAAISQIIASKLSFTAPAITATIEQGGSLYQAQFDYEQNKEWKGTIKKNKNKSRWNLIQKIAGNWDAVDQMPAPAKRKIWSVIPTIQIIKQIIITWEISNYAKHIGNLFTIYTNDILDYHRKVIMLTNTQNVKMLLQFWSK